MAGYLLNLSFDAAAPTSTTGLFNDPDPAKQSNPDPNSKMWFNVPAGWPSGAAPTPGQQIMQGVGSSWPWTQPPNPRDDKTLPCNLNDIAYIRLVPRNGWSSPQLRFATVFGRTPGAGDSVASPFLHSNNGVKALFHSDYTAASNPGAGGDNSWIFYLGQMLQNAPGRGGHNGPPPVYSFIVAATVSDTVNGVSIMCDFGHDPKIIVGGGGVKP
jgi:hypothetical protein